ncbi:MAG: pyridoxamine 5'-phosphate oxidase [Candidatus Latescibacterota bacterium]|nr:MAG: pyridoxamine 5'-phosphate oxidase [Candidatus Latescibacterota bacterium]
MAVDPIEEIREIIKRAHDAGDEYADAAVLATVDDDKRPSARVLLVKHVDRNGLVFYTNMESRKAQEIESNPNASLCFWWPQFKIQIRVEGKVTTIGEDEADTYFATRPRGSQIAAWVSSQSDTLHDRDKLAIEFADATDRYRGKPVPRPPHWSGYRILPESIEIWRDRPDRLHERQLFTRTQNGWKKSFLYP